MSGFLVTLSAIRCVILGASCCFPLQVVWQQKFAFNIQALNSNPQSLTFKLQMHLQVLQVQIDCAKQEWLQMHLAVLTLHLYLFVISRSLYMKRVATGPA